MKTTVQYFEVISNKDYKYIYKKILPSNIWFVYFNEKLKWIETSNPSKSKLINKSVKPIKKEEAFIEFL